MKSKRILAAVLAGVMVFGSSLTAFADDSTSSTIGEGTGTINLAPEDVIAVKVPTSLSFDFQVDGDKLLNNLDPDNYGDATLLFANTTGASVSGNAVSSNTSDVVEVVNFSSCAVDVEFTGKVTVPSGVNIATDSTLSNATAPALYFALEQYEANSSGKGFTKASVSGNPVVLGDNGGTLTGVLDNDAKDYTAAAGTPNENGINQWTQTRNADSKGSDPYYFALTGNATEGGWSKVTSAPTVTITYVIKKDDVNVTNKNDFASTKLTVSTASTSVTLTGVASGATLSKVMFHKTSGDEVAMTSGTHYTYSNGTFTVVKTALLESTYVGAKFVLTFSDSSTYEIEVVDAS